MSSRDHGAPSQPKPSQPKLSRAEAARRNGAKSKGPTSPQGKASSSQNARKHGMCAAHTVLLRTEDAQLFHHLHLRFRESLRPQDPSKRNSPATSSTTSGPFGAPNAASPNSSTSKPLTQVSNPSIPSSPTSPHYSARLNRNLSLALRNLTFHRANSGLIPQGPLAELTPGWKDSLPQTSTTPAPASPRPSAHGPVPSFPPLSAQISLPRTLANRSVPPLPFPRHPLPRLPIFRSTPPSHPLCTATTTAFAASTSTVFTHPAPIPVTAPPATPTSCPHAFLPNEPNALPNTTNESSIPNSRTTFQAPPQRRRCARTTSRAPHTQPHRMPAPRPIQTCPATRHSATPRDKMRVA